MPKTKTGEKYASTKTFTAKRKRLAFKCFQRVIEARDINLMDRNLYAILQHCGFVSHGSIQGFKNEYGGYGFKRFIEHFVRIRGAFILWNHILHGENGGINSDMTDLALAEGKYICAELESKYGTTGIPLDIDKMSLEVMENILEEVEDNWRDYFEEDGLSFNNRLVFDRIFEVTVPEVLAADEVIREMIWLSIKQDFWTYMETTIKSNAENERKYRNNPLGYYGLSQRDFL